MISSSQIKTLGTKQWKGLELDVFDSISQISHTWDSYAGGRDIFLSSGYLSTLEACPPNSMSFYYVTIRAEGQVTGIMYFQLHFFDALKSLNYTRTEDNNGRSGIGRTIREFVAGKIQFYTLVCGNVTLTGSHGFILDESVTLTQSCELIDMVCEWLSDISLQRSKEVRLIFVKDFREPLFTGDGACNVFTQYHEFQAQPAMVMEIDETWTRFSDYLEALQSKYRVRVRRARKMGSSLERRILTLDEIRAYNRDIYAFYSTIARNSVFNLFLLDPEYFVELKQRLGEDFQITGYFLEDELVAFNSVIHQGSELVAHFLGYHDDTNKKMQIYLNMLFDIVEYAITHRFQKISFARTALEIKSSVGAKPQDMMFYLRFVKALHNPLIPAFYNLLEPEEEWTPRTPFKTEQN